MRMAPLRRQLDTIALSEPIEAVQVILAKSYEVSAGPQESTAPKQSFNLPATFFGFLSSKLQNISSSQPECALPPEQSQVADPEKNFKEGKSTGKSKAERSTDFRNPQKIPAVKPVTFVYPHADEYISAAHRARFPVIMDIFQQNLQEDKKLSLKNPTKTEYRLKMCGTGIYDTKPSILVSHPWNDVKTGLSIMKTLTKPQVREQYDSSLMAVRFKIYLFLGPSFTYLGRRMESLDIRLKDASLTGAILVSDDACDLISTVTCGVCVKNRGRSTPVFALTPAHAFERGDDEGDEGIAENVNADANAFQPDDKGVKDEEVCEFADVEYDIAELLQYESSDAPEFRLKEPPTDLTKFDTGVLKPKAVGGKPNLPEWYLSRMFNARDRRDHSNRDWALVEIENSDQWPRPDLDYELIPVKCLRGRKEAVDIITSRGVFRGTIGSTPSFIANARQSGAFCKVWTVTTVDSHLIFHAGDSGALVTRPGSLRAYGYVVAVNHSRELYIVPLEAALKQICMTLSINTSELQAFTQFPLDVTHRLEKAGRRTNESEIELFTGNLFRYWPVRAGGASESSGHSASDWKPTGQEAVLRSTPWTGSVDRRKEGAPSVRSSPLLPVENL